MTEEAPAPVLTLIRAIDVKPHFWGVWCTVGNSEPFVNPIVNLSWRPDGTLSVMLDSFNFDRWEPDQLVELVAIDPPAHAWDRYAAWELGPMPDAAVHKLYGYDPIAMGC